MPPRYGRPPGFGGAYDTPGAGQFQSGTETGVVDPNVNRFWTKYSGTAFAARGVVGSGGFSSGRKVTIVGMRSTVPVTFSLNGGL